MAALSNLNRRDFGRLSMVALGGARAGRLFKCRIQSQIVRDQDRRDSGAGLRAGEGRLCS